MGKAACLSDRAVEKLLVKHGAPLATWIFFVFSIFSMTIDE
jgi:hypothetical protein